MDIFLENQFEKLAQRIERRIVAESLNELAEIYLTKTAEAIVESIKADRAIFNKLAEKYKIDKTKFDDTIGCASALLYVNINNEEMI